MVSFGIRRRLVDAYLDIMDKDSAESKKDRERFIDYTLVAEAVAAYCAFSRINGMAEEPLKKFVDQYRRDEDKRHEYRARLLSCKVEDEKYKRFKKFAMEFEKVRKKLKENDSEALNNLETLFFNLLNELTYI